MKLKTLNQKTVLLLQSPTLKALLQAQEEDTVSIATLNACIDCLQDEGYGVSEVLELYERDTISQWLLAAFLKAMTPLDEKQGRAVEFVICRTVTVEEVVDQMARDSRLNSQSRKYRTVIKASYRWYAPATLIANPPMKPWFGKTSLDYDVGSAGSRIALHKLRDKIRAEIIQVVCIAWEI